MKLRSIIIAAIVLISVFSVAASADGVLFGTPVVDGLLDSLYLESETITVTGKEHTFHTSAKGSKDGSFGDSATAYFLHDGEYLYACVKVNDNSVYTRGKEWVLKYIEQLSWENDAVEVRVYYTELGEAVQSNQYIFQADAYGFATENYLDMCGEEHTVATTINESGYICEFKIPLSFNTAAGEKIGLAIEIDDLHEQLDLNTAIGKNNFNAYGSQHPYKNMVTLSSEKAVKKIDITDDTKSNWARTSIEYVLDSGVMKAQGNAFNPYAVMSTKDVFDTMSSIYTAKTARVISDSLALHLRQHSDNKRSSFQDIRKAG